MGWSPGSLPLTTAPTNGNGVFLTVGQDNTQVFVDYNNDGTPDATYTLNRLQSQFVPPGPTGALDGARFYATGLFSMSYGENADTATTPTPNLDLGYVALPATDFVSLVLTTSKSASPAVVSTASGSTTSSRSRRTRSRTTSTASPSSTRCRRTGSSCRDSPPSRSPI